MLKYLDNMEFVDLSKIKPNAKQILKLFHTYHSDPLKLLQIENFICNRFVSLKRNYFCLKTTSKTIEILNKYKFSDIEEFNDFISDITNLDNNELILCIEIFETINYENNKIVQTEITF